MKMNADDKIWAPKDRPEYLCVLGGVRQPPASQSDFLSLQAQLLGRLWDRANEGEREAGNLRLQNNLEPEALDALPSRLLQDRRTCRALMENPALEGSPLHEWKRDFEEVAKLPPMSPQEAKQEAESLSLESFLARLL